MALLADGWHMGTHAAALGVAVFAYVYARRRADGLLVSVACALLLREDHDRALLARFPELTHVTVEVNCDRPLPRGEASGERAG